MVAIVHSLNRQKTHCGHLHQIVGWLSALLMVGGEQAMTVTRLVVDCRVVVKWKIPTEEHAAAAEALFVDWEHQVATCLCRITSPRK
jgi:hypothetical protein